MSKKNDISRRSFLKWGGLAGGAVGLAGSALAGYEAGQDTSGNTGWEREKYGQGQFFNRQPFEIDDSPHEIVGTTRRINYEENIFNRNRDLYQLLHAKDETKRWTFDEGVNQLPEPIKSYYTQNPESLQEFKLALERAKQQRSYWKEVKQKYILADAWSHAHASALYGKHGARFPDEPEGPPEEWDFRDIEHAPLPFKSPAHASALMKKIAYSFGATLVGITKLNPDWVYQGKLRGVGKTQFEVPKHWKYAIVFAIPHEWEAMYANPTYGTSYDAYSKLRWIGGKLDAFIRHIGYAARPHVPPTSYELIIPPLAIDAGLGELGRNGIVITPELGANTRIAAITTNMELEPDKPINVGIRHFCNKCKICAETCPSGAISFDDKPTSVSRGYKKWYVNQDKCLTVWNTVATSHPRGCRVCLAVCPYSRKNNWIHTLAREMDPRDPTGAVATAMLAMQKNFFEYPDAHEFLPQPDGSDATYHDGPEWLKTEEWCDFTNNWE